MAQETNQENQSKKRKKWIENLSVFSSEDEDSYKTTTHEEEKQNILKSNKAIYLRFPYYMGSDNSDDEDGFRYFPNISPMEETGKSISSSDEMPVGKVNLSYKHTKRKQTSNLGLKKHVDTSGYIEGKKSFDEKLRSELKSIFQENLTRKSQKDRTKSKEKLKSKDKWTTKKVCEKTINENSSPHFSKCHTVPKKLKDTQEVPATISPNSRRRRSFRVKTRLKLSDDEEDIFIEKEKVTVNNHGSGRFLDSSSEDSDTKSRTKTIFMEKEKDMTSDHGSSRFLNSSSEDLDTKRKTKTKHTKYRRINILSTSSSSSDSELKEMVSPQNHTGSEGDVKPISKNKQDMEFKPSACLSSEEDDGTNQFIKMQNEERTEISQLVVNNNHITDMSSSSNVSSNFQRKINPKAWKNIAISEIKSQFNKQSKVVELKKKLMTPNAPSVAVYRKIQEMETLRNKYGLQRRISSGIPSNNQSVLPQNGKTAININDCSSIVTSQCRSPNIIKSMIQDNSSTKQVKSTVSTLVSPEMSINLPENSGENVVNSHVLQFEKKTNSDSFQNNNSTSKKVRYAHNRQKSTSAINNVNLQIKVPNHCIKNKQLSKENKSAEPKQLPYETSKNFDVLGNIMSQMDNNPFKIQKPQNKKIEPTSEILGRFPAGSNASPIFGQTQNAYGPHQPRIDEFPLKHLTEMYIPPKNETNLPNPSFNPLCSTVLNSSKNKKRKIREQANFNHKKTDDFKISQKRPKKSPNDQEFTTAISTKPRPSSSKSFVPFYLAPNEDYGSIGNLSSNKTDALKSSTSKPGCANQLTGNQEVSNNKPQCMDLENCYEKLLGNILSSQVLKEPRVSEELHSNNLSKNISLQVSTSKNSLNQEKNILQISKECITAGMSVEPKNLLEKPQTSAQFSEVFKGNIRDIKDSDESKSKTINKLSSTGIRVRFGGTEFRLTKTPVELNDTGSSQGSSKVDQDVKGSGVKCSNVTEEGLEHKNVTNKRAEMSDKTVSSSSSTSLSSSSMDDSSSESSDDGASDDSVGKTSSLIQVLDNISESKQSFLVASDQTQNNSLEENKSAIDKNSITLDQNHDSRAYFETKHFDKTSKTGHDDEVILLSSSSDSDSTQQIAFDDTEVVGNTTEQPKKIDQMDEIINLKTTPDKSNQIVNQVGRIRVKSLRELGVITDNEENKNSLASIQANLQKDSQTHIKEQEKSPPETQSSNTANQEENCVLQSGINKNLRQSNSDPKKVPEKLEVSKSLLKQNTIFIPVLGLPIAIIKPANTAKVKPLVSSLSQGKDIASNLNSICGSSFIADKSHLLPTSSGVCKIPSNGESQNPAKTVSMPFPLENVESTFFSLCDKLFTDVVLFKIPKLADDLHLLIAYDIMKEERLKKIDQLISPETIISEKRRAEKEYADMIKIRGQSFVPLFMTIVKRMENINLKASLTAVYCKIVHQLERIDPVNNVYRFKIRNIIKGMLQKHSNGVSQEILSYFDTESDQSFFINFGFVENLLVKYDNYVLEKQTAQASQLITETPETSLPSEQISDPSSNSPSTECSIQSCHRPNHNLSNNFKTPCKTTPPIIGNLDELFLKKNIQKK